MYTVPGMLLSARVGWCWYWQLSSGCDHFPEPPARRYFRFTETGKQYHISRTYAE